MKKTNLTRLIESVSLKELQRMIAQRGKLDQLEKKRAELEKSLTAINRQIESVEGSIGKKAGGRPGRPKGATKKKKVKRGRRRIAQPSLSSVILELLQEKKKPMKVNEICDGVLTEKGYKTKAKNFKSQVRILLYKNEKGLFKKLKPGLFGLVGGKRGTAKRKVSTKRKTAKKKTATKKH